MICANLPIGGRLLLRDIGLDTSRVYTSCMLELIICMPEKCRLCPKKPRLPMNDEDPLFPLPEWLWWVSISAHQIDSY